MGRVFEMMTVEGRVVDISPTKRQGKMGFLFMHWIRKPCRGD